MKLSRLINVLTIASMLIATVGFTYTPAVAQGDAPDFDRDALFVPGELIVRYGGGFSRASAFESATSVAKNLGGSVARNSGTTNLLSFDENADVEALAREIAAKPGVVSVQPNYIYWVPEAAPQGNPHTLTSVRLYAKDGRTRDVSYQQLSQLRSMRKVNGVVQKVPSYPVDPYAQWGWWAVDANIIWPSTTASPGVCVLDTGVDDKHPDLKYKVIKGLDFVNDDTIPNDDNGHGTHVAGTIAAVLNNKVGFAGISNGKVIAVKVLSAQGWGTSWDIGIGIGYCADRTDVKVINMSLGGSSAGAFEFFMLDYAINTKGKLVVAAAGNDTTSDFSYPAAWAASFVCDDGSHTFPAACGSNTIHAGLLSVGAAGRYHDYLDPHPFDTDTDGYLWVDVNGDTVNDPGEDFPSDSCATWFSNYGAWVEIVAPGEDILSSVPVSYPFYDEYYYDVDPDNDGYDWFNGTSMATPHVAAGAARAWSVFTTFTNAGIATQLLGTGDTFQMSFAADPTLTDVWEGYDGTYNGEVPFCWPDSTYGTFYDTSGAVYLNVAAAMDRGATFIYVYDAVTGVPLKGATVKAFTSASITPSTFTTLRDTSKLEYDWQDWADLLNIPATGPAPAFAPLYVGLKVNKSGYTSGDQFINWDAVDPGYYQWGPWFDVGIPPVGRITGVANWECCDEDLDLFTWTPPVPGYVAGPYDPGGAGIFFDEGDLADLPFMRWNRDGGFGDFLGLESVSIKSVGVYPYYSNSLGDYYDFVLTDYGSGLLASGYVAFRVWRGGVIIGFTETFGSCDTDGPNNIAGDIDDEIWWQPSYLDGSVYVSWDNCGTGEIYDFFTAPNGAWPYVTFRNGTTSSISDRPAK